MISSTVIKESSQAGVWERSFLYFGFIQAGYGVGDGNRHIVPQTPGQPASRPQARTPLEQAGGVHMMIGDGDVPGVEVNVGLGGGVLMVGNKPRSI